MEEARVRGVFVLLLRAHPSLVLLVIAIVIVIAELEAQQVAKGPVE